MQARSDSCKLAAGEQQAGRSPPKIDGRLTWGLEFEIKSDFA